MISARRGEIEEPRRFLMGSRLYFRQPLDYWIKLAALTDEKDLAIELIRQNPFHRNYRWLTLDPDMASLSTHPPFQNLLDELHQKWQRDVAALGPSLPALPRSCPRRMST
jgi:hypothetical protein